MSSNQMRALLAAACAMAATGCGVKAAEPKWGHWDTGRAVQTTFMPSIGDYGVPAASAIDFGHSAPMPTSDLTY